MTHRFGEFFLEPQWPCQNEENEPRFSYYQQDELQEAVMVKQEGQRNEDFTVKYEEKEDQYKESNLVPVKEEYDIYDSSEQMEVQDSEYVENIQKLKKQVYLCKQNKSGGSNVSKYRQDSSDEEEPKKKTKKKKKQYQRGKYNILSQELKKQIVDETKTMTMVQVAKKYNVSVNNICRWRKRCDRRLGAGRKVTDMDMERKLLSWLMNQSHPIPRKQVQATARRLSKQQDFKASKGWFQRFYKRNKLHYHPNIQILTHNDYKIRIMQFSQNGYPFILESKRESHSNEAVKVKEEIFDPVKEEDELI